MNSVDIVKAFVLGSAEHPDHVVQQDEDTLDGGGRRGHGGRVVSTATATFDPRSATYLADPQAALQEALAERPVWYHHALDTYYVLGYDEVRAVVADGETYSSHAYKGVPVRADLRPRIPEEWERAGQVIQGLQVHNLDAPEHTAQRRALQRTFTHKQYTEFMEERRADPGDDLCSAMLTLADEDGRPVLSTDEVMAHMIGITAAGTDTTANLIIGMVRLFTERPDQLALVLDDPDLWDNAIQEGLRRASVATQIGRRTTRPSELGGMTIPAGATLALSLPAANGDPRKFPDPLRFDVRRANANEHLALGRGRHYCLGATLAPPEARIALEALYRRLPGLEADLEQELQFVPSLSIRGIVSQRATWQTA